MGAEPESASGRFEPTRGYHLFLTILERDKKQMRRIREHRAECGAVQGKGERQQPCQLEEWLLGLVLGEKTGKAGFSSTVEFVKDWAISWRQWET